MNNSGASGQSGTPLVMAAMSSKVDIMQKLINAHANVNAIQREIGPVINGAIISGDKTAVELLLRHGATLSYPLHEDEDWPPPLALAALLSDFALFTTLLEAGGHTLTSEEYHRAFSCGCGSGRTEVVQKLLEYDIDDETFQGALEWATQEENWDIIKLLLQQSVRLDCADLFKKACEATEDLDEILTLCQEHDNVTSEILDECLFIATDKEKEKLVRLLLGFGANPNAKGEM